jgi:hypothetical protein
MPAFYPCAAISAALDVERFNILRDLMPEPRDEIVADDMVHVEGGAFGFRPYGVCPEVSPKIVLRKGGEKGIGALASRK